MNLYEFYTNEENLTHHTDYSQKYNHIWVWNKRFIDKEAKWYHKCESIGIEEAPKEFLRFNKLSLDDILDGSQWIQLVILIIWVKNCCKLKMGELILETVQILIYKLLFIKTLIILLLLKNKLPYLSDFFTKLDIL